MIGRDHLDSGSVASPYRETESMADGSDPIADWPLLNALVNTAAGASWVSIHDGGGVGIGRSLHAGMVCVADGTDLAAEKLERVLTTDPGTGVMRHADAGYERAIAVAEERGVRLPMRDARVSVREVVAIGDPVLRERARELSRRRDRLAGDPGADRRPDRHQARHPRGRDRRQSDRGAGAGGDRRGRGGKPALSVQAAGPAHGDHQPVARAASASETVEINEGCLSVPDLRGSLPRHLAVRVRYLDREGEEQEEVKQGLTAGTFQHEVDHLDGILFVDRRIRGPSRPGSSSTAISATSSCERVAGLSEELES